MRTIHNPKLKDHAQLANVQAHQHHPAAEDVRIIVNSLAIAPGAYQYRVALSEPGHLTARAILRGNQSVDIVGHAGAYILGNDTAQQSASIGLLPYGGSGYVTSYMGGYSRLHGDAFLSQRTFGTNIYLRDVFIDGTELVLEFYNSAPSARNLVVYGSAVVK